VIAPSEESQDVRPPRHLRRPPAADPPSTSGPAASGPAASAPAGGAGTDDPQVEANAAERVIFFSDAVVAIAITLLALLARVLRRLLGSGPRTTNSPDRRRPATRHGS
jgi:hypothetical protein